MKEKSKGILLNVYYIAGQNFYMFHYSYFIERDNKIIFESEVMPIVSEDVYKKFVGNHPIEFFINKEIFIEYDSEECVISVSLINQKESSYYDLVIQEPFFDHCKTTQDFFKHALMFKREIENCKVEILRHNKNIFAEKLLIGLYERDLKVAEYNLSICAEINFLMFGMSEDEFMCLLEREATL